MEKIKLEGVNEKILTPIMRTGWRFYALVAVLAAVMGWAAFAWWYQLTNGLVVTGLRDFGTMAGAPWGVYISSFIWYVGMAHGGIAVSAAIRLMKLKQYKPIARMAEAITIVTLLAAGINIVFDVGRPDRIFNMVVYYWDRVGTSPLVWDLTVLLAYLILSATYLVLSMREDLALLYDKIPRWIKPFYKIYLVGYDPSEREKVEQMTWWLALCLIILMSLLSGGVIPWLFGLMVSQPGWFGAVQGPAFLTAALTSAVAIVMVIAYIVRKVLGLYEEIGDEIFRGLGKILAVLSVLYLWFVLHEQITLQYAGPMPERTISEALLFGQFAPIYWTVIGGLIIAFVYLAIQAIKPTLFSAKGTFVVSLMVVVVLWIKRYLIVVPSLLHPRMPYPTGVYIPTWVEWSLFVGTLAMASLLYIMFVKIYPLMELRPREGE